MPEEEMPLWRRTLEARETKPTNPKDLIGTTKAPIHLIPPVALILEAEAFRDGAEKYGAYNWREKGVKPSIYVSAAMRHIMAWWDGEENAKDSGVHHLAHARACLAILLDSASVKNMVDDRPQPGRAAQAIASLNEWRKEKDAAQGKS